MKICGVCGHQNPADGMFCEECGNSLAKEKKNGKFCPACGWENDLDAAFCEECGHAFAQAKQAANQVPPQQAYYEQPEVHLQPVESAPPKPPMSKKNKNLFIGLTALAALSIGGYLYGKQHYSQENQIERLYAVVETRDPAKLAEVTVSKDPNYKISSKELKKYTDYYKADANKKAFADLLKQLKNGSADLADLKVEKSGKYFGLYDKYQLVMEPAYLNIKATQENMKLKLDDKEKEKAASNDFETTWGPLTPGDYQVAGEYDNESVSSNVRLVRFENNEYQENANVVLDMHKVSFMVKSNVDGADVYVGDQKVGTIENGSCEVKDLIWHQGMVVQLKKELEGEEIVSNTATIRETEYLADNYAPDDYMSTITLDFENIKTTDDLQRFLNSFYAEVTRFTNDSYSFSTMDKQDFAENFADGDGSFEDNDFEKFINGVRNSGSKRYVDSTPKVESMVMTGKDTYQAQYLIEYRTVYKDYGRADVTQVFRYKKADFIYDEEDGQFKLKSLGGEENFETVDGGGV